MVREKGMQMKFSDLKNNEPPINYKATRDGHLERKPKSEIKKENILLPSNAHTLTAFFRSLYY